MPAIATPGAMSAGRGGGFGGFGVVLTVVVVAVVAVVAAVDVVLVPVPVVPVAVVPVEVEATTLAVKPPAIPNPRTKSAAMRVRLTSASVATARRGSGGLPGAADHDDRAVVG